MNLTWWFFLKHSLKKIASVSLFYARLLLALLSWLVILPFMETVISKVLFDSNDLGRFLDANYNNFKSKQYLLLSEMSPSMYLSSLLSDIFEGQMVSSLAVLVILLLFIVKEYIGANTPLDQFGNPVAQNNPVVAPRQGNQNIQNRNIQNRNIPNQLIQDNRNIPNQIIQDNRNIPNQVIQNRNINIPTQTIQNRPTSISQHQRKILKPLHSIQSEQQLDKDIFNAEDIEDDEDELGVPVSNINRLDLIPIRNNQSIIATSSKDIDHKEPNGIAMASLSSLKDVDHEEKGTAIASSSLQKDVVYKDPKGIAIASSSSNNRISSSFSSQKNSKAIYIQPVKLASDAFLVRQKLAVRESHKRREDKFADLDLATQMNIFHFNDIVKVELLGNSLKYDDIKKKIGVLKIYERRRCKEILDEISEREGLLDDEDTSDDDEDLDSSDEERRAKFAELVKKNKTLYPKALQKQNQQQIRNDTSDGFLPNLDDDDSDDWEDQEVENGDRGNMHENLAINRLQQPRNDINELNNDNPPRQNNNDENNAALNIDINLNIDENGMIDAQIQADGDLDTIWKLLGVQGSLFQFFSVLLFVLLLMCIALIFGCFIPYHTGKFTVFLFEEYYIWGLDLLSVNVIYFFKLFTDPILDPLANFLAGGLKDIFGDTIGKAVIEEVIKNLTINAVGGLNNTTRVEQTKKIFRFGFGIFNFGKEGPRHLGVIPDMFFYPIIGYGVFFSIVSYFAVQVGALNHPYMLTFKTLLKNCANLGVVSFKFVFFLGIELGVFPVYCGFLIDICTIPVFGPLSLVYSRIHLFRTHYFAMYLLHWGVGTTCMFGLASYVHMIRRIVRPGVMWFVRDPNDPEFHPLNEIMTRPILVQLKKLLVGVMMYTIIIVGVLCGTISGLKLIGLFSSFFVGWMFPVFVGGSSGALVTDILPLRWDFNLPADNLFNFQLELVVFYLILPIAFRVLQPKKRFETQMKAWFISFAKVLRISEFLLGQRYQDEETDLKSSEFSFRNPFPVPKEEIEINTQFPNLPLREKRMLVLLQKESRHSQTLLENGDREFHYMRVPNSDHIEVIPGKRMLVPMRFGEKLFGRVGETPEEVGVKWRIVYVPKHFYSRIVVIFISHWLWVCNFACWVFIWPFLAGRITTIFVFNYLKEFTMAGLKNTAGFTPVFDTGVMGENCRPDLPVDDVFSFVVGVCVLSFGSLFFGFVKKFFEADIRLGFGGKVLHLMKGVKMVFKFSVFAFWIVIFLPLMLGNMSFLTFQFWPYLATEKIAIFNIYENYITGIILTKILYWCVLCINDFRTPLRQLVNDGVNFNLHFLFHKLILPITWHTIVAWIMLQVLISAIFGIGPFHTPAFKTAFNETINTQDPTSGGGVIYETSVVVDFIFSKFGSLFPWLVGVVLGLGFLRYLTSKWGEWMDRIRDEEFLVGRTLHNIE